MCSHLIVGGARSGKSAVAVQQAVESGLPVCFVATAQAQDAEMAQRIQQHQASRPAHWQLVEEPVGLGRVLAEYSNPQRFVIVDCLTLWLTNLLLHADPDRLRQEQEALLQWMWQPAGPVVLVGNETGLGIQPLGELTRRFVDANGLLNQELAKRCSRVTLVVAGIPLSIKGP
ncbi:MAG: bifunctional adenosylcobinamide kinase/adenosylcobinamide-phosphate guanylyltransferase [Magnetococcales bacterium]|nr:bifunctional adenosylcobinamide kinase/adenosylcobinamide-phosphate guanylyltransferase [Magnetococcales bacterium]